VKHLSSRRAALLLLLPVLVLFGLIVLPIRSGRSQATSGPTGTLLVALTGNLLPDFRSISFNVLSVRLNPSTDINVSDVDPNWVTIPVAPGVGLNTTGATNPFLTLANLFNLNTTGPSPASGGTGASELQVDIGQVQSLPQIFNSFAVPASTYNTIELVLDGSNAGTAIPDCEIGTLFTLEGCIASQIAMFNPSSELRTTATVTVPLGGLTTLVININPFITAFESTGTVYGPEPPLFSGGLFTFNPVVSVPPSSGIPNLLGLITGPAVGATQVAAELSGTNQIVETTTTANALYTLVLPATASGTLYDLVASGPGFSYGIAHNILAQRSSQISVALDLSPDFQLALTGKVTDQCSGAPIQGATVDLLQPAPGTADDCTTLPTPSNCVVVATASTDDTGTYPMPASNFMIQAFNHVPDGSYTMVASAAGYDTLASPVAVSRGTAGCSAGRGGACNLALGRAQIEGLVSVSPPLPLTSQALNVLVSAEDHGTHHIENVGLTTLPPGSSAAPFSMFVPDNSTVPSLDLYATVSDTFNGLVERDTGHTIGVMSGITGGGRCGTNATGLILAMQCVGHGSVTAETSTFDDGTSIVLSKGGVQLMSSSVSQVPPLAATPGPTPLPGQATFCAPADPEPYTFQRFEASPPAAEPSPVASPVSAALATPTAIASPCFGICSNGTGTCLVCKNSSAVMVP
jgi:Carboxypeptidase regulatory-like domain